MLSSAAWVGIRPPRLRASAVSARMTSWRARQLLI
jgi:hypothetical protein